MALNDGLTLMHEHMSIALSPVFVGLDMIGKAYGKGDEYRADRVRKINRR